MGQVKTENIDILFIYGSLKKGFDNHNLLSKGATYIGKAIPVDKYGSDTIGLLPIDKSNHTFNLYKPKCAT